MVKITKEPRALEYPMPVVMVSCGSVEEPHVTTVSWTGMVCAEPAMTYIAISPSQHSYDIIKENGEFVINFANFGLLTAADFCGFKSGKNVNKFEEMNLTAEQSVNVQAPQIQESPVSLECKVVEIKKLGSHDMFLAEILAVNIDEKHINKEGRNALEKSGLLTCYDKCYYTLGRNVGDFNFSACKRTLKAKENLTKLVVEVKEPRFKKIEEVSKSEKVSKPAEETTDRKPREGGDRGGRNFDRKPREDGDRGGRSFDRKPREGGDRGGRSFDRKPREGGDRGGRSFDRKPREGGDRGGRSFDRKPREGGDRGGRSFDRKPREGGDRGGRSFDRKPREGGDRGGRSFDRKPREGGDRGGRSFDRKPREGGDRGGRSFDRKPREGGDRGGRSFDRKPREGGDRGGRSFDRKPRD